MAVVLKPGQGYWTRTMSALTGGILAVATGGWVWQQMGAVEFGFPQIYAQAAGAAIVILILGLFVYWLVARKPKTVEFMIATEGEMRKVNWSTRREIASHTWVVVGVSLIIAVILFATDLLLAWFFARIGVIQTA